MSVKKTILAFALLFSIIPVLVLTWAGAFKLINNVDTGIYIRFATDNRYDKDVFLDKNINDRTGVYSSINQLLSDVDPATIRSKQEWYAQLLEHKEQVLETLSQNKSYTTYLKENHLVLDDFMHYIEKMATIDQTLMSGCFYAVSLLYILIFYFFFRYRIRIYAVAFAIYLFSVLNQFTSGISGNLFFPLASGYFRLLHDSLSYNNYLDMVNFGLPAIKEALLTYIIMDVIGQYSREKREKKTTKLLKDIFAATNAVLKQLKMIQRHKPQLSVRQVKVNYRYLLAYCRKKKRNRSLQPIIRLLEDNADVLIRSTQSVKIDCMIVLLEQIQRSINDSGTLMEIIQS